MKSYEEIRDIYIVRYQHLAHLGNRKSFARAALMLEAPEGISLQDLLTLSRIAHS